MLAHSAVATRALPATLLFICRDRWGDSKSLVPRPTSVCSGRAVILSAMALLDLALVSGSWRQPSDVAGLSRTRRTWLTIIICI